MTSKYVVVFRSDESSVVGPFNSREEAQNYLEAELISFPDADGEVTELCVPEFAR